MGSPPSKSLPPASAGRLIDTYAGLISDPAQKLRFLNAVFKRYEAASCLYKSSDTFQETVVTQIVMDELKSVCPDVAREAKALIRAGKVPPPSGIKWHVYRFRNAILGCMMAALILGVGSGVAALKRATPGVDVTLEMPVQTLLKVSRLEMNQGKAEKLGDLETEKDSRSFDEVSKVPVHVKGREELDEVAAFSQDGVNGKDVGIDRPELVAVMAGSDVLSMTRGRILEEERVEEFIDKAIWQVEKDAESELYSNGLRILTGYTIDNEPRSYYRFARGTDTLPSAADVTDEIAGILYHASESDMIDFEPEKNDSLNRYSKALVRYIHKRKSYNYFIDRFGRVYRIVQDDHAAYHAGWSVWADRERVYLNLNHAFIGICFEGKDFEQVAEGQKGARISPVKGGTMINEGQLTSGRKLTDWLRVKYEIGQHNCVTHGLASVNPQKMLIGYHLDLVRGFPFERLGLKDKTRIQLPALTDCGFSYDDHFVQIFDGRLWEGIAYSENYVRHRADLVGMSHKEYRQVLADRFAKWFELYRGLHG